MSQVSFETPEYTANADALGTLRLLEAIRILGMRTRSASIRPPPRSSTARCRRCRSARRTPFYPRSPYAAAKLYAYWITVNYREAYGMHASNGILFNHEGPMRGETFVTRKITRARRRDRTRPAGQALSRQYRRQARLGPCPRLCRGHVADPAAGSARRLRAGDRRGALRARIRRARLCIDIDRTHRLARQGRRGDRPLPQDRSNVLVAIDPRYYRPTEVDFLLGDPSKAREVLGWHHKVNFEQLVAEMVEADRINLQRERFYNA